MPVTASMECSQYGCLTRSNDVQSLLVLVTLGGTVAPDVHHPSFHQFRITNVMQRVAVAALVVMGATRNAGREGNLRQPDDTSAGGNV
jgi:hypothetical protein